MGTRVGTEPVIFTNVGMRSDVEIGLTMYRDDAEGATLSFGCNGEVTVEFCDVDSLERLAAVAADGARQLQERIDANSQDDVTP